VHQTSLCASLQLPQNGCAVHATFHIRASNWLDTAAASTLPPAGALLLENELQLLPREVAYSRVNGVWNLSSEAGNQGTFYITNCRVVWFSTASNAFNVSIPYLQVRGVNSRSFRAWLYMLC
jgi:hypothetical protein